MKKMKKILSLITALLLIFSLSACGGNKDTEETAVETEIATEESTDVATEAASEEKSENTSKEASADEKKETKEESASKEDAKEGEEAPDKNETPQIETEVITPSENKNDNRPTVYWATSEDKDTSDVSYHKKDCAIIKDKEPAELAWEIIDALGMPACEKCKPN